MDNLRVVQGFLQKSADRSTAPSMDEMMGRIQYDIGKKNPSNNIGFASMMEFIRSGWLSPKDEIVRKLLIKWANKNNIYAGHCVGLGWLSREELNIEPELATLSLYPDMDDAQYRRAGGLLSKKNRKALIPATSKRSPRKKPPSKAEWDNTFAEG